MQQQNHTISSLDELLNSNARTLSCVNLQLSQQFNQSKDQDLIQLQSYLANCTEIQILNLDLSGNNFKDNQIKLLFTDLPGFKNMDTFNLLLNNNNISHQGVYTLANFFKRFLHFKKLALNLNSLKLQEFVQQKIQLSQSNQLTDLCLRLNSNQFGDIGIFSIAEALNDEGGQSISLALSKLKDLIDLKLFFDLNQIADFGSSNLATGLSVCTQITSLELGLISNKIGDKGLQAVGRALKEIKLVIEGFQIFLQV
ncbi:hypothetical protein ABPG72_021189 [Tetrahymena utriculariae]